jgi:type IV pilus assembly protein PilA
MLRNLSTRRFARGFTLIELLVVTLILSILMAVAIPLYLSSVADAKLKTCRANMQTIANAVQSARVKGTGNGPLADYQTFFGPVDITKETDLSALPTCPNAGTYAVEAGTVNPQGFEVKCSFATDGKFEPGVDNH